MLNKVNLKIILSLFFIVILGLTVVFCVLKPVMHKGFNISVIEYVIKFNKDGSLTQTKQVKTHEVIKDKK